MSRAVSFNPTAASVAATRVAAEVHVNEDWLAARNLRGLFFFVQRRARLALELLVEEVERILGVEVVVDEGVHCLDVLVAIFFNTD